MIEQILELDQELLVYLNSLGSTTWDWFWLLVTHKLATVPLYVSLLVLFARFFGYKQTGLLIIFGILVVTTSDQLANVFKYGFERLRPCHQEGIQDLIRIVKGSCGGKYSYFSAHASTAMALAVFFSRCLQQQYPKLIALLLVVALFVGYSRIYIGVHYPLDVLTGFCIGAFIGFLGSVFFKKLKQRII